MKRFGMIVLGTLLAGCASNDQTASKQSNEVCKTCAAPATNQPATPAAVAAPATPATPAAPAVIAAPKDQPIFELTQDDKVYVFPSVAAMTDFNAGKAQPTVVEKPHLTPGGKTVVFQAADQAQADAMQAAYAKLHPVAK